MAEAESATADGTLVIMTQEQRLSAAIGLDVFVVVLFVAIGRRNHDEEPGLLGVLETAAPFLIGLAAAWLIMRAWRRPTSVIVGLGVWPLTVLIGMNVRRLVFDEGTATSFVLVATVFLGAFLIGWRATWRVAERRTRATQSSGGSLSVK